MLKFKSWNAKNGAGSYTLPAFLPSGILNLYKMFIRLWQLKEPVLERNVTESWIGYRKKCDFSAVLLEGEQFGPRQYKLCQMFSAEFLVGNLSAVCGAEY